MEFQEKDIIRFWNYVNKKSESDCWEWNSHKDKDGYGVFAIKKKCYKAHRFSYMLEYGEIPEGLMVRHYVCNNPSCVNPNHLLVGTAKDNYNDSIANGTNYRGEVVNTCKIKEEDVLAIRKLYYDGVNTMEIAELYGLSDSQVRGISMGISWKHIGGSISESRKNKNEQRIEENKTKIIELYNSGISNKSEISRILKTSRVWVRRAIESFRNDIQHG